MEAARRAGLDAVPCVCYDDMTPEEVREYRIADNRLAEIDSNWDLAALDLELQGLDFGDLNLGLDFEIDDGDDLRFREGPHPQK